MSVKSFTIYEEYYELIDNLPEKEKSKTLVAITDYMFKDIEPNLIGMSKAIFNNLKRPLDIAKNNSKRSSGNGAPKGNQNATKNKPNSSQKQTKNKPKTNQIDNQKQTHQDVNVIVNVNVNKIIEFIENNMNRTISSYEYEQIELLVNKYTEDIVLLAFKKTIEAGKKSLNYTKAILKHWEEDGLKTIEDIKNQDNKKEKKWWEEDE